MSKKALGKGLDALFSSVSDDQREEQVQRPGSGKGGGITEIPISSIVPNPHQPRKTFDSSSLQELAASIREKGVIQPILVQERGEEYVLIAGERRFKASQIAELETIPALIVSYSEEEQFEIALIENIQREDLLPIDEALAYAEIMKLTGCSQEELSKKLGKNRSTLANSLRLLKLPENMQDALQQGKITPGHARAILSVSEAEGRNILFAQIVREGYSVRQAEEAAAGMEKGSIKTDPRINERPKVQTPAEIKEMERKLLDIFGTKIAIKGDLKKGRIEISYYSLQDLERIYEIVEQLKK